jgi:hypothetical protein
MSIDLQKELTQKNVRRRTELQEFGEVKEMKLLMENTAAEERKILRHFDLDENVQKVEALRGQIIESETFTTEFGNCYQVADIAMLAKQYRLRFLPLSKFKGGIDPLLATKIVAFGKEHNIDPTAYADNFYVLAPAEDFRLTETKHYRPRPVISQDPLLFYKTDRDGKFWTMVHKWGTEFNYIRMVRSLKYRDASHYVAHWSIVLTAVAMLAFTSLIGGYTVPMWAIALISAVLGTVGGFVKYGCLSDADENNLFTEKNWTDSSYHKTVNWDE